jgi:hypothetical protein
MLRNKRERFEELAELRVNKALNFMRLIENLGNRKNYDYEEAQANQIISALEDGLRAVKHAFRNEQESQKSAFRLKK